MPIVLNLYRCFCHGLKMCMWFGYYPQINFHYIFGILNVVIFRRECYQSVCILDTLCAQLLQQFYANRFEPLQVFLSWSEDVHVVWILSSD